MRRDVIKHKLGANPVRQQRHRTQGEKDAATRAMLASAEAVLEAKPIRPQQTQTPLLALTIPQFCEAHGISAGMFFKLKRQGLGPREMKLGTRRLISLAAANEWCAERQVQAAAKIEV
jgi:predicted DNA-binding transcriptional regulator AlpA